MKYNEIAMKIIGEENCKIKRKNWKNKFIEVSTKPGISMKVVGGDSCYTLEDLASDDWEIIED